MTIREAIDTLKVVLTKTNNEEVKTAVQNSINLLNNFGKDTLANPAGENFELPKNIEKLIVGMDSGASPRKVDDPAWAQELNKAILTDNLNLHRDAVKKAIGWDTGLNLASIISAAVAFLFFVCVLIVRPIGLIKGDEIDFDKISFFQNFGDIIIMLVAAAISAVSRLCAHKKGKKFCSAYGTSIAKAKNLIITEEEYKEKIQQARQLYLTKHYRGNIRKAKRIYNKLLKRDSTDPNCFVGLLAICSNNFTTYSGKCKEGDLIEDIEASKGDDNYSRLNAAYKDDYLKYKKEKVDVYKEKESKALQEKNRKRREYLERVIPILQQIGIYTVLVLPILLSIVVIVLTFCMPVKSFDNYSGWLYTTIFAADCLSAIAVVVMGIVLSKANKNPCFNGFGIGDCGYYICLSGIVAAFYAPSLFSGSLEWWEILVFAVGTAVFLFALILGLIKHKGRCIPRFLLVGFVGIFVGCTIACGLVAFVHPHDHYTENSDGTYTYVICNKTVENLKIPSEYCGKPVTAVARAGNIELKQLKSVVIPDSVTSIGSGAFEGCASLENLTIPYVGYSYTGGVTDYDGEAECIGPIGYLFGMSSYNGGIAIKQDYRGKFISGDKAGKEVTFYRTYYIPASLKNVTVLGGEVCDGAFYGCSMLKNVVIGDRVTKIGNSAFYKCTGLESITIGGGVTSIGTSAFLYCSTLTSITIPDSVTSIGDAFDECGAVHKIKGISYVDKWAVGCDSTVTEAELSSDTVGVADYAFVNRSLSTVILNEGLKYIGEGAFARTGITTLTIPRSVTSIGANAFSRCTLSDVSFDDVEEWYADGTYIPSSDLSDSTQAVLYLTSTYVERVWKRGNN